MLYKVNCDNLGNYTMKVKYYLFDGTNSTLINDKQFEGIIIYSVTKLLNIFKGV